MDVKGVLCPLGRGRVSTDEDAVLLLGVEADDIHLFIPHHVIDLKN